MGRPAQPQWLNYVRSVCGKKGVVTLDLDDVDATTTGDVVVFSGTAREFELGEETLEMMSTGLYAFDGLAIGTPATGVDVGAGNGHITNTHDDPAPANWTYNSVSWAAQTVAISAVATPGITYMYVDSAGAIQQTTTDLTPTQRRENIFLGRAIHTSGSGTVIQVQDTPDVLLNPGQQIQEILDILGIVNRSVTIGAASTDLTIANSAGNILARGANFTTDRANPHDLTISAASPITFRYIDQDTGGASDTTSIVPGSYDVSGTVTAIPGSTNRASAQPVYLFTSGNWRVAYAQTYHNSLSEAVAAIPNDRVSFVTNPFVPGNGVLIGWVVVTKGATNLSDPTQAVFVQADPFGLNPVGVSQSVSTYQNVYDNSAAASAVTLTDSTTGAVKFQRGSAADTDDVFEVLNGAGTQTFGVTGEGNVSCEDITVAGDLTVNGTTTTFDSTTVEVTDSQFHLAKDNTSADTIDLGWYGSYNPGAGERFSGIFRDATDGTFKLYDGLTTEPTTTVDTADGGYSLGDLDVAQLDATTVVAGGTTLTPTTYVTAASAATGQNYVWSAAGASRALQMTPMQVTTAGAVSGATTLVTSSTITAGGAILLGSNVQTDSFTTEGADETSTQLTRVGRLILQRGAADSTNMIALYGDGAQKVALKANGEGEFAGKIRTTSTVDASSATDTAAGISTASGVAVAKSIRYGTFCVGTPQSVSVASGAITATSDYIVVDTESSDPTDDLETISGVPTGATITLRISNSARVVTFKDNTGNLRLAGDFVPTGAGSIIMLVCTGSTLNEVSRSQN